MPKHAQRHPEQPAEANDRPTLVLLAGQHPHGHVSDILWIEVSDGIRDPVQGNESFSSIEVAQEPEDTEAKIPVGEQDSSQRGS